MWRHIEQILQVIVLATTMLVSFLHSLVRKRDKMSQNFSLSSYHNAKLQQSYKNISSHT